MAIYPNDYPEWTTKYDYTTVVYAEHINTLQAELVDGIQRTLGLTPQVARNDPGSTPYELQGVVSWLGEAPTVDDVETIADIITDSGSARHQYNYDAVLAELRKRWPDWSVRA
mgnify:FL=1